MSDDTNKKVRLPYELYESTSSSKIFHFYISEPIGAPNQYIEMIHQIRYASANDTIYIHLCCPGGRCDTGVQIINAMRHSPAHIVTCLESEAHSMATYIFLSGSEFIVEPNCRMLFHYYSGGASGKGNELEARVDSNSEYFSQLAYDIYIPFLTKEEVSSMIQGIDLWLTSDEITKRLLNMVKQMETKEKKPKRKSSSRKKKTST